MVGFRVRFCPISLQKRLKVPVPISVSQEPQGVGTRPENTIYFNWLFDILAAVTKALQDCDVRGVAQV